VERLEDEADGVPAEPGQRPLPHAVDAAARQLDRPGVWPVQAAEQWNSLAPGAAAEVTRPAFSIRVSVT
jgi:hypothetical protein